MCLYTSIAVRFYIPLWLACIYLHEQFCEARPICSNCFIALKTKDIDRNLQAYMNFRSEIMRLLPLLSSVMNYK